MKIMLASPICHEALARLRDEHDVISVLNGHEHELMTGVVDCDAIIFRSGVQITSRVMDCSNRLKLLIRAGSGIDNLDVGYVEEHDIALVRLPGPGARAVAELTFALMLVLARQVLVADHGLRQGLWLKHELKGALLKDKRLGVVGLGNIGTQVGRMGALWGMDVVGCVGHPKKELAAQLNRQGIRLTNFSETLETADFLSLHVSLNETTRNLISTAELDRMKPGSFLLNMARGGVVDEKSLLATLKSGTPLAGAALDVHQQEGKHYKSHFADMPNVVLTPHIGSSTTDTQKEIGSQIISAIDDFINKPREQFTANSAVENDALKNLCV